MGRFKNRVIAKLLTAFPSLFDKSVEKVSPAVTVTGVPWTPFARKLSECRVAIVTTAGVHLKDQEPFDMADKSGDPTYRALPASSGRDEYTITHDYYDKTDAMKDLNIVFPIDRLRELASVGYIGGLAPVNYSFMGHIDGPHIKTLMDKTAPEVAAKLKDDGVDVVLLTPG